MAMVQTCTYQSAYQSMFASPQQFHQPVIVSSNLCFERKRLLN